MLYREAGDYEKAEESYKVAAKLKPEVGTFTAAETYTIVLVLCNDLTFKKSISSNELKISNFRNQLNDYLNNIISTFIPLKMPYTVFGAETQNARDPFTLS